VSLTYQVLAYVALSFGWFSFFAWKRKKRMDHMHAMIIGMSMGMMIGLIAGLLFGAEYKGDLFLSTIWGMLIGVFVWFQSLPFSIGSADNGQLHSQNHMSQPAVQEINLIADDFSYKPNRIVMKKGVPMKVTFQNNGKVEHDFEVVSTGEFIISSESTNNHQHGNEGKGKPHLHAKPGETATSVWQVTEVGTYEFYCTIPGHKENGMIGKLVVL
jgi:uncharacterized cupredoxin-like copper-binding protein